MVERMHDGIMASWHNAETLAVDGNGGSNGVGRGDDSGDVGEDFHNLYFADNPPLSRIL